MKSIGSIRRVCLLLIIIIPQVSFVWAGYACLSNPCIHGVCLDGLNTTYSCYCIDGYTGVQCQTNWDECWSSPCQNGGLCHDGIASFNCSCPAGFVGSVCEEDFNECESNPCLNNGTCLDVTNGYTCMCLVGYSGTHCEVDIAVCDATNETRCANGGVCVEGPGVTFSCRCPRGWEGYLCEAEVNECMSAPCQNGAICIDHHANYSCACLFGFTGQNCEEVVMVCDDSPCKNGALCLMEDDHPVCYCVPDYHGDKCQYQYDECQLGPRCMNGGSCIDGVDNFTCSCPPKLTGVLCECLILDTNTLDCTYVRPTSITEPTTQELSTITTTTIPESSTYETTTASEVPNLYTTEILENVTTTEFITSTTFANATLSVSTTLESTLSTSTELPDTTQESTTEVEPYSTTVQLETTEYSSTATSSGPTETVLSTTSLISTTSFETTTEEETTYTSTTVQSTLYPVTSTVFTMYPNITSTVESTYVTETFSVTLLPTTEPAIISSVSPFFTEEPSTYTTGMETDFTTLSVSEYTTYSAGNVTPIVYPDCSKTENRCQHGGTCMYKPDGYRCICPFDAEGVLCEKHLGIRNAAFGGGSFLSHRLLNRSRMSVQFKAKTFSSSGLIFYSNIDTSYMALYIENGYLKFKFSCGFQTMLLSEVEVPVNNGFEMTIKVELKFSKDFTHCEASINVNDTLTMSGDQIASVDAFAKPNYWLHLGGIPQEHQKENLPSIGFVGCMSDLKISGKKVLIFKDAEDGFGVSECSSLACLSNPCSNGATCSAKGDSWICNCKNGYLGKTCELSVCENNPCQFGGTCLPFTGSGYICLCPFGKHGHFCENDLEINQPYFSSSIHGFSSFIAYPIPGSVSNKLEIKFKFTPSTMEQISIMMFIGQKGHHDSHSDHMAVSFVKGYIMLTWNLGSGPRRIFTTKPIKMDAESYLVHLGRLGRRAWLYVENLGNITGRSPGSLVQLDVMPILYLGGHDSRNFSALPHDLPLHTGFAGCIFDVEFKSGSIVIPLEGSRYAVGRALGQCGTTECHEKICQNGGACLYHGGTFTCLCQDGWFGPMCSTKFNPCDPFRNLCSSTSNCVPMIAGYECDCPIGRTGKYCEKEENITDVSFSGTRSYVSLDPVDFEPIKFNIDFELRPLSDRGLVLYIGRKDFVSLYIQSGLLELRVLPSRHRHTRSEVLSFRSNKLLIMGVWHKIKLGMYGRKLYMFVDNVVNTALLNSGDILNLSGEIIYLGGLPDLSTVPNEATASLPTPFTGCLRQLHINSKRVPLRPENIKSARNIGDCDGTPCGGDYCESGGSCWLDPNLNAHCSCPEPFYGDRCEMLPSCEEKYCENNGRCISNKCICSVGWSGAFCENSISIKTPKFLGNSFLIVSRPNDKKRDLNSLGLKTLFLNFTTASPNGVILWSQKGDNFVGIGLEKGHVKIIYSLGSYDEIIEVLDRPKISDGLWHNLEISFSPLYLTLDQKLIDVQNDSEVNEALFSTDGLFYLGGLPDRSKINKISSVFPFGFEGCIETFGLGKENLISDFSNYKGENIDVCNIV